MKSISDIDPNFRLSETVPDGMKFYDPFDTPFSIWGVAQNKRGVLCRLPEELLSECSNGIKRLAYHLAGACIRFSTDAEQAAVLWELTETGNMPHFAASGQSGLELFEETDSGTRYVKNLIPAMNEGHGCRKNQSCSFALPGGMRSYVLYLPLYNGIKQLQIGFPEGAQILSGRTPKVEKPVVFYGSSITQGGCACKAGSCYSTILCRRLDAAQINLGFSGNAKGEEIIARYIASLPMSVFVLDYDHNAPTPEHLLKTHEPFYRIIREAQPDLPIIMISRPDFDKDPNTGTICRNIIRGTYAHALTEGDKNVYFVDGKKMFGKEDRDMCTVDGSHPNDLGFLRMADMVEPVLRGLLYPQK